LIHCLKIRSLIRHIGHCKMAIIRWDVHWLKLGKFVILKLNIFFAKRWPNFESWTLVWETECNYLVLPCDIQKTGELKLICVHREWEGTIDGVALDTHKNYFQSNWRKLEKKSLMLGGRVSFWICLFSSISFEVYLSTIDTWNVSFYDASHD
jgi:hypothetical protein